MWQILQSSVNGCCCATLLSGCDLLVCRDKQALIASALVAEPDHTSQQGTTSFPAKVFKDDVNQLFEQLDLSEVKYQGEPEVEVALVASMRNTIATVRKYQPIEPSPEGIGKQSAGVARKRVIKWTDQTQKVNGLYTKHSYPASGTPASSLAQSTLTTRQLLARKDASGTVVYDGFRMYDKVWCNDQPTDQSNQFYDNIAMCSALSIGLWTSNTLTASGNVEETVYKILYFATCSCAHSNSATMVE